MSVSKFDVQILKDLEEKAKDRMLGMDSLNYYYALKHTIEFLEKQNKEGE